MNKDTSPGGEEASRVAARINNLRKDKGLSVEELSNRTGIPTTTLYRKLNASPGTLTLREVVLISRTLGVPAFEVAS